MPIDETFPLLLASATLEISTVDDLVVEVRNELGSSDEDLVCIFEVVEGRLALLQSDVLFLYELLLLGDVFLDFVEEKVDGLLLVILDLLQLIEEAIDVLRRSDLNVVFLALVQQEL